MKKILLLIALLGAAQLSTVAQTPICDCKINEGKNTLVITGSVTLTDILHLSNGPKRSTYRIDIGIVNKSNCTLVINNIKIANYGLNPKLTLTPQSEQSNFSKSITATKPAVIKNLGGATFTKVAVSYTLNGKKCSQIFELQYFETVK